MKLTSLPAVGRYMVDTEDATYDVDLDAHVATRWDAAADGAGRVLPDETLMFERIACEVGAPMFVEAWLAGPDGTDELTHVSAPVLGITLVRGAEVTA